MSTVQTDIQRTKSINTQYGFCRETHRSQERTGRADASQRWCIFPGRINSAGHSARHPDGEAAGTGCSRGRVGIPGTAQTDCRQEQKLPVVDRYGLVPHRDPCRNCPQHF